MKTAISLPDATYERVTRRARELGLSRSELFVRAAEAYLDQLDSTSVTARMDESVMRHGADESSAIAAAAGRSRLQSDEW